LEKGKEFSAYVSQEQTKKIFSARPIRALNKVNPAYFALGPFSLFGIWFRRLKTAKNIGLMHIPVAKE
jgi:hypothetical protein